MLRSEDLKVAERFKLRLKEAGLPLLELKIYGSRARGEATPESDMDAFLIVERINEDVEELINHVAWDVGFQAGIVITTSEYTPSMLEDTALRASPFVNAVLREGVAI